MLGDLEIQKANPKLSRSPNMMVTFPVLSYVTGSVSRVRTVLAVALLDLALSVTYDSTGNVTIMSRSPNMMVTFPVLSYVTESAKSNNATAKTVLTRLTLPVTSDNIGNRRIKLVTFDNMGLAVGISTLSSLRAEIWAFEV